jgi:hypothetical protein
MSTRGIHARAALGWCNRAERGGREPSAGFRDGSCCRLIACPRGAAFIATGDSHATTCKPGDRLVSTTRNDGSDRTRLHLPYYRTRFRYSSNLPVFFWFPTQIAPFTPRPLGPRNSIEARSLAPAVRARPLPAAGALRASACANADPTCANITRGGPSFARKCSELMPVKAIPGFCAQTFWEDFARCARFNIGYARIPGYEP